MNINTKYIKKNCCYPLANKPKYIVIHETDNFSKGADALKHAQAHAAGNLGTSVHYYVDDGLQGHEAVYQTLKHEDAAWSVGKTYGTPPVAGVTNYNVISIEICVNPETRYETARLNCVDLVKQLIESTGIPAERVIRHYDAKRKYCPRKMMDNPELWTDFKNRIIGINETVTSELLEGVWTFKLGDERLTNQWVKYKNKWFYVDQYGHMVTGCLRLNDKAYYLNESESDISTYGALMVTENTSAGNLTICHVE